ncbi:MAG TPA: hypothetical protein DDW81_09535, partial [Cryomorphaceae bacterium]|nr:hypothetical protein [Cryomorphaceae bacterium]
YRKSRGLVVLDSFNFRDPIDFQQEYDFRNIEPFTLIIKHKSGLFKVIHNEEETLLEKQDPHQPHIWSSTTLYTEEVRHKREVWFANWLKKKPELSPENITRFHLSAGDGDHENDLVMSRWGILKTVSLTQISGFTENTEMTYLNFVSDSRDQVQIKPR